MDMKKIVIKPNFLYKLVFGTFAGGYVLYKSLFRVEPGFQALKFNIFSGVGRKIFREGYHLLVPFVQRPIIYDCKLKNNVFNSVCGTKGNIFY
jgi:hypothetical protein